MNWLNNQSSTSFYRTTTISNGINLREEFHEILYGSIAKKPLGHWIILRQFNINEKSVYYNKYSNESLGGPKYTYHDILLRVRRQPYPKLSASSVDKVGDVSNNVYLYFFEYTVVLTELDQIFELDVTDHTYQPQTYNLIDKYDIKRIIPNRMEDGNIQFYTVVAHLDRVGY